MDTTTFETAKVGDRVWCVRLAWGEIRETGLPGVYPISVRFPNGSSRLYTLGGFFNYDDVNRSLFWDEVKIKAPQRPLPELEMDTKVLVWNKGTEKAKRHFSHFDSSGRIVCFYNGRTSWTTNQTSAWNEWELAELKDML